MNKEIINAIIEVIVKSNLTYKEATEYLYVVKQMLGKVQINSDSLIQED